MMDGSMGFGRRGFFFVSRWDVRICMAIYGYERWMQTWDVETDDKIGYGYVWMWMWTCDM
jgi:hypothetical protein